MLKFCVVMVTVILKVPANKEEMGINNNTKHYVWIGSYVGNTHSQAFPTLPLPLRIILNANCIKNKIRGGLGTRLLNTLCLDCSYR